MAGYAETRGGCCRLADQAGWLAGQGEVQGSRDALEEIERCELAGQLLRAATLAIMTCLMSANR